MSDLLNTVAMTAANEPDYYQVEEVQEILQLAFARQEAEGELTRLQLEEIATELGIPQSDLVAAEQLWLANRDETQKKLAFTRYRHQVIKQRAVRFGITNSFLCGLNMLQLGHLSWSLYILLIWGLFFSLRSWRLWQTSGEQYDAAYLKWERNQQLKQSVQTIWQKAQAIIARIA